ncbi:FtsK/SpoIIIE domain-containing protein [Krasilnikovia sp. MM14-A1004]|uniref:FtsK/SpoIIIE domain-containing protein n=1 Tax=Krasilnikovia sp. MM14-A1004 TaxID=3373541 RepID=UPI00399C662A
MTTAIARDPLGTDRVPVGPRLSMFDPMFIGIDEFGHHVTLDTVYHNLLIAGEPGAGKSGLINLAAATAALADNTRLVLLDAKFVELGPYADVADAFIGNNIEEAIRVLRRLLTVATNRYLWLLSHRRRKVMPDDGLTTIVTIIDELAMFSTVLGTKAQQEEFEGLLRGLVSLGRACGMPVIAATQRTSWDIIPASLRDLFGYRCAFRCTTNGSSDVILGQGWADLGYSATDIDPANRGAAWLLAEGGIPRRIKCAFLTDAQIYAIADYAAWMRRPSGITVPAPALLASEWGIAA